MRLSDQLEQDHMCGDFGQALEGYAERARELEMALAESLEWNWLDDDAPEELREKFLKLIGPRQ